MLAMPPPMMTPPAIARHRPEVPTATPKPTEVRSIAAARENAVGTMP
ncbi:hypothetical protein AB7M15_006763 [Bradyrhizobium ottawaense]